jgi:hypothetical protein
VPPSVYLENGKGPGQLPDQGHSNGVSDGARTRDTQDHNLVLYQLSYTHHVPSGRERREGNRRNDTGGDGPAGQAVPVAPSGGLASPAASSVANEPTTSSAAPFAWSLFGPGVGTNRVRR